MESSNDTAVSLESKPSPLCLDRVSIAPFAQEWITITKQQYIELEAQANYWQSLHSRAKVRIEELEQELLLKDAKIKDLQNRLFGKKSEKQNSSTSQQSGVSGTTGRRRNRGQQSGRPGHGRTPRPNLAVIDETIDLAEPAKHCPVCGLPFCAKPALDEVCEIIEVQVQAHRRRIRRPAYVRAPGCCCLQTPTIITAPPPVRLLPRSPYGISFWVEVILSKFRYGQPIHRYCQDLRDLGLPVSPGTIADGLQALAPLFQPVVDALYRQQMGERVFHNDETRWEVFEAIDGKIGSRWYLWVTRSASVIYFCIDPSRSAAVPGAHFAGLLEDQVIIVCDRYSAYKKLARLVGAILLAFCWAHVRRDFLDAGRALAELEAWVLDWKARIGELYHLNQQRLAQWRQERPLSEQNATFGQAHQALQAALGNLHDEAARALQDNVDEGKEETNAPAVPLSKSAQNRQRKIYRSLIEHWPGLTRFVDHPEVPMDNNLGENSLRGPVTGRKNYYGSGSVASAECAALLFSILQTLVLWGINPRQWLTEYLAACAENGGKAPERLDGYLPWTKSEASSPASATPSIAARAPPAQTRH
jgi:transposase